MNGFFFVLLTFKVFYLTTDWIFFKCLLMQKKSLEEDLKVKMDSFWEVAENKRKICLIAFEESTGKHDIGKWFFNMGRPRPLFRLFSVFSNKQNKYYNKSMWKMSFSSSVRHQDSNPRPFKHELSPITTRPGLPPGKWFFKIGRYTVKVGTAKAKLSNLQLP